MPNKNRWELQQIKDGISASLSTAVSALDAMYADSNSTIEARQTQENVVKDLTERLKGIDASIKRMDDASKPSTEPTNEADAITHGYAGLVKATMRRSPVSTEIKAALKDEGTTTSGSVFLPKTVSNQIITEPVVKNPLRDLVAVSFIENLEIPRLGFTLSDDDFIADGATAKELATVPSTVAFTRNKFKVFCDISETILSGSEANLVSYVNQNLASGLAAKEKKVMFATSPKSGEEHMSFYSSENGIKEITGTSMFDAITDAYADLEDAYSDNAVVVMRKADYIKMIKSLSNGSRDLFGKTPEEIIGIPVVFCDKAVKPVVGDFNFGQLNYSPNVSYENDKNVRTGMTSFVITAYIDFRIKLASAFRICNVSGV